MMIINALTLIVLRFIFIIVCHIKILFYFPVTEYNVKQTKYSYTVYMLATAASDYKFFLT